MFILKRAFLYFLMISFIYANAVATVVIETWDWVSKCKTYHAAFKGQTGVVCHFGDEFTSTPSYSYWARAGLGQTSSDKEILSWMHINQGPIMDDNSYPSCYDVPKLDFNTIKKYWKYDGWWLAHSSHLTTNRTFTAINGIRADQFITGLPTADWGKFPPFEDMLDAYNPEIVIIMLGTNDAEVNRSVSAYKVNMENIIKRIIWQDGNTAGPYRGTIPIINTIPPKVDDMTDVNNYNKALVELCQQYEIPLIDFYGEILMRRPLDWHGTLILSDGTQLSVLGGKFKMFENGSRQEYNSMSDPYTSNGEALMWSGFLLRSWLSVQKVKEVKSQVIDSVQSTLTITSNPIPGYVSWPYETILSASGGVLPYKWSIISGDIVPLTLDSNGVITGLSTAIATFNFTARVIDSKGNQVDKPLIIDILASRQLIKPNYIHMRELTEADKARLILPEDFEYKGAFKFPSYGGGDMNKTWNYGGQALTYYPQGDSGGLEDGYPGSLFGTGFIGSSYVSEVTIPAPVISKNWNNLPVAKTLQPFGDISEGLMKNYGLDAFGGLMYFPKQGAQTSDKLYWGAYIYYNIGNNNHPTLGWCELNLAKPEPAGIWHVGPTSNSNYPGRNTGGYIFEIPKDWADKYVGGKYLATGYQGGCGIRSFGPTIYAVAPWKHGNPPTGGTDLDATILLAYNEASYPDYARSDLASATWLTAGKKSAVVITWEKGGPGEGLPPGENTYNCSGTRVPPYEAQILFYDPDELAEVAQGRKKPSKVIPYALYRPAEQLINKSWLHSITYDRERGFIYMIERSSESTCHVFKVNSRNVPSIEPLNASGYFSLLSQSYPNPFNPECYIPYTIRHQTLDNRYQTVKIKIYNILGQVVKELDLGEKQAGSYVTKDKAAYWDGRDAQGKEVVSGVYYYELVVNGKVMGIKKSLVVK